MVSRGDRLGEGMDQGFGAGICTLRHMERLVNGTSSTGNSIHFFFFFFFFFCFLGLHLRHMEVSKLKVELELQLLAYTTASATRDPSHICNLHHTMLDLTQ